MTHLLLSILALALGPVFVALAKRLRSTATALDAFVLVAVGGLVLLHILPESILQGGWPALACGLVGFFAPVLTDRLFRPGQRGVLGVVLVLALTGLAAHSVLDGIGLTVEDAAGHEHELLAWAIILHRLPVGIGIWWIVGLHSGNDFRMGYRRAEPARSATEFSCLVPGLSRGLTLARGQSCPRAPPRGGAPLQLAGRFNHGRAQCCPRTCLHHS
ncbi:MAG: ZIP family metal transporter [Planctomycetota bacterium]